MRNFLFTIFLIPFLSFSQYGVLDETFGDGGIVNYTIPIESSYVLNMEIDSQGSIYILGSYSEYNDVVENYTTRIFISKLNESGSLDTSFGNEGYVTYEIPDGWLWVSGFKIINNQKILVAANYEDVNMMLSEMQLTVFIQFNLDGTLDSAYGNNGLYMDDAPQNRLCNKLSCNENYCFLAGNKWSSFFNSVFIERRNLDGTIDETFADNGVYEFGITISGSPFVYMNTDIATNEANELLCLFKVDGEERNAVFRLNQEGIYQSGINFTEETIDFFNLTLTDSNVYLSGSRNNNFAFVSLTQNLTIDTSFGNEGWVEKEMAYDSSAGTHLLRGENGRFTQIGWVKNQNDYKNALVGYKADGSTDFSFGENGQTITDMTAANNDFPSHTQFVTSDKVLVLNSVNLSLARYNIYGGMSVEDISPDPQIQIAPNPASNSFFISGLKGNDNTIKIFDLSGKSIREFKAVRDNQQIELGAIPKGIYLIKINDSETKKLIVR